MIAGAMGGGGGGGEGTGSGKPKPQYWAAHKMCVCVKVSANT